MKSIHTDQHKMHKVLEFMQTQKLAALATVTVEFLPESAIIGILPGDNLELFFATSRTSRKYQNLQKNPKVALAIGWEKGKTIQYEGFVQEINDLQQINELEAKLAEIP